MNELALFSGAGGGILGSHLLGWRTVCAVEIEPYPISVLLQRQNDGILPPFPIWDNIETFDGRPWRGIVDVVSGGFPCQDISSAGRGSGINGERSGLWKHMVRIISETKPTFAFIENSPLLTKRGLKQVLSDIAEMGFDAEWGVISASDLGGHHERKRIWIKACNMANPSSKRQSRQRESFISSNTTEDEKRQASNAFNVRIRQEWPIEPELGRVADGVANRMDRLKAIGNGQVPRVAATAFTLL